MKRIGAIILLGLALTPQAAKGGDADELKALGFSPDGRYFAFEQHGATEGATYSGTTIVEVATSRPIRGSRTSYSDEERKRLAKARTAIAKQIKRLKISPKGFMTVSVRGIDAEPFQEASVKSFALPSGWFEAAQKLGCVAVVTHYALMDAALVARLHAAGMRALAYTVNDPAEVQRLCALGIDSIITDAVDRFSPASRGV